MTYLVLARKWRPKDFSDTVGQEHVLQALINALESGRLHHAYLFAGTRGVGKTTIARILAKALNCETGVTATPRRSRSQWTASPAAKVRESGAPESANHASSKPLASAHCTRAMVSCRLAPAGKVTAMRWRGGTKISFVLLSALV